MNKSLKQSSKSKPTKHSSKHSLHTKSHTKRPKRHSKRSSQSPLSQSTPSSQSSPLYTQSASFSNTNATYIEIQAVRPAPLVDPKDGTFNHDPGWVIDPKYPTEKMIPPVHLRKFVHSKEDPFANEPVQRRAPIKPEHLTIGYRYFLRHLKHISDPDRRTQFARSVRTDFDLIRRFSELHQAEIQIDRAFRTQWSQLSVIRMNISKLRRPKIPASLEGVTTYLGAQEGTGRFYCSVPSNDPRHGTILNKDGTAKRPIIIEASAQDFAAKAKMYNMDLHPADIERHYELIERYHFNGKERRGGW